MIKATLTLFEMTYATNKLWRSDPQLGGELFDTKPRSRTETVKGGEKLGHLPSTSNGGNTHSITIWPHNDAFHPVLVVGSRQAFVILGCP